MTQVANGSSQKASRAGDMLSLAYILAILVIMGLAGLVALQEGLHRFMLPFVTPHAAQDFLVLGQAARADPSDANMWRLGAETWGLSKLVSNQHFVVSKLVEQGFYYASMPRANQVVMVVHVLFSVFCVLAGGLQFWPAFRKRFMKAHRVIGMTYAVTVPVGVVAALIYLGMTPPHAIYANLVAWIALWIFGGLALISVAMALRALRARRIFEHQAWMALSFGSLSVAPLLRWDWVFLAWVIPGIDQETLNLVTMGVMLPESLLLVYGLILINRQYVRPIKQRKMALAAVRGTQVFLQAVPAIYAIALALLAVNVGFYIVGHGMSSLGAVVRWVPAALVQREHVVLLTHPVATALFAVSLSLAFPLCVKALKTLFESGNANELVNLSIAGRLGPMLVLVAGLASCFIGWHIGLAPDRTLLSGGTMYVVDGVVLIAFSLLFFGALRAGRYALLKESLVFLLCLLPFPALFLMTLTVMSWLPMSAIYVTAGQGFILPVGSSAGMLFVAMFYVVYGQATREHN